MRRAQTIAAGASALFLAAPALAEEVGSGHYMPGSMASFVDGVSPVETFVLRYNLINYEGSAGVTRSFPVGGETVAGLDVSTWAQGLTLFWRPSFEIGGNWSYAASTTIPYVSLDITAEASSTPGSIALSDGIDALGDILLMPLMLNYEVSEDASWNYRIAFYAPTGDYEFGRLANTGKNFWSVDPTVAFVYFGKQNGRELSAYLGATFNEKNDDTDYRSGTQAHLELTAAQHFPAFGGLAGAGLTGYWYEQLDADSGAGATLGDFEARSVGLGPVLSLITKIRGHQLVAELKWVHEFETRNRVEGDTVFLKVLNTVY